MAIQLNRREKLIVWIAGILIGIFVLCEWALFPYLDAHKRWNRQIAAKKVTLAEMQALKTEYSKFKQVSDQSRKWLKKRDKHFSLFTFLNIAADKVKIKKNLTYMKPSTIERRGNPYKIDVVEMKFSKITLKQLAEYLYTVETSGNQVVIKRATLSTPAKKERYLDVTMLMETIG